MQSISLDLPLTMESERLFLQVPQPHYASEYRHLILGSQPHLTPWVEWAMRVPTLEESRRICEAHRRHFDLAQHLTYFVFSKQTGTLMGDCSLHHIDWTVPKMQIGYWLAEPFTRLGYMTEAVDLLSRFAFHYLEAKRLEIRCDDLNERSWRLAERSGFELEGILRSEFRTHTGRLRDTRIYARVETSTGFES